MFYLRIGCWFSPIGDNWLVDNTFIMYLCTSWDPAKCTQTHRDTHVARTHTLIGVSSNVIFIVLYSAEEVHDVTLDNSNDKVVSVTSELTQQLEENEGSPNEVRIPLKVSLICSLFWALTLTIYMCWMSKWPFYLNATYNGARPISTQSIRSTPGINICLLAIY